MALNKICHYRGGSSNKTYLVYVIKVTDGEYRVGGKWGRTGTALHQQIKHVTQTFQEAQDKALQLFRSKIKKGYQNIEDPDYDGPLTFARMSEYLEHDIEAEQDSDETDNNEAVVDGAVLSGRKPVPVPQNGEDIVVMCLDNTGMEDNFSSGVTYVVENEIDEEMFVVSDKRGREIECYRDRFRVVVEE